MSTTFTVEGTLVTQDCGKCGGIFAISEDYDKRCHDYHGQGWHCPYCKTGWHYIGKSAERKQCERADRAEARARDIQCNLRATERQLSATRGVVTRTKNRISKGVCPCCTRSFQNLKRHMASKHPEYSP